MRAKLLAFMVGAFTGVAGAMIALQYRASSTSTIFSVLVASRRWRWSSSAASTAHGAILGTALIVLLPETLNLGFGLAGERENADGRPHL